MPRIAPLVFLLLSFVPSLEAQSLLLKDAFPHLTFTLPIFLTSSKDHSNRVFVVQQNGFVHVFPNDSSSSSTAIFLDVSARLSSFSGEEGLLGMAFPPDFRTSHVFYVNYTAPSKVSQSGIKVVVARYAVSPSDSTKADSSSEKILLEIEKPFKNHNGGMLAFGPDSMLYIGVGDGGDAYDPMNNGQSVNKLLGKILRIDVRGDSGYTIPRDNPFVENSTGARKEIWAYGLRNPWRFSFDTATGLLWVGDVGQGTLEEIDIVRGGHNYGWKIMEGNICTPGGGNCDTTGLTMPIAVYGRDLAKSIIGGYVYQGSRQPQLRGGYIFGDFLTGNIFLIRYDGAKVTTDSVLIQKTGLNITSFGVDEVNELYILSNNTGKIKRFDGLPPTLSVESSGKPYGFELEQNYPNPFNPTTRIRYTLGRVVVPSKVKLIVYDLLGREVATLVNEVKAPGSYEVIFDGRGLPSGVYICRLTSGYFTQSQKIILLK